MSLFVVSLWTSVSAFLPFWFRSSGLSHGSCGSALNVLSMSVPCDVLLLRAPSLAAPVLQCVVFFRLMSIASQPV